MSSANTVLDHPSTAQRTRGAMLHGRIPLPLTTACALLWSATDLWGFASSGPAWRYVLILGTCVLAVQQDLQGAGAPVRRLSGWAAALWVLAFAWATALVVVAALRGTLDGTVLIVPAGMTVAAATGGLLLLRSAGSTAPVRTVPPRVGAAAVSVSMAVYAILALVDALRTAQGTPAVLVSHERVFVVVLLLALARTRLQLVAAVLAVAAAAIAFAKYPSATTALLVVVVAFAYSLLRRPPTARRVGAHAAVVVGGAAVLLSVGTLLSGFYAAVGRSDNTATRLVLWTQAEHVIAGSPMVGGAAGAPITAVAYISGAYAQEPFHNTALTLAVFGGAVQVALLALAVMLTLLALLVAWRSGRGGPDGVRSTAALVAAALGALVAVSVNPVLDKLGSSLPFSLVFATALVAGLVRRPAEG